MIIQKSQYGISFPHGRHFIFVLTQFFFRPHVIFYGECPGAAPGGGEAFRSYLLTDMASAGEKGGDASGAGMAVREKRAVVQLDESVPTDGHKKRRGFSQSPFPTQ